MHNYLQTTTHVLQALWYCVQIADWAHGKWKTQKAASRENRQ